MKLFGQIVGVVVETVKLPVAIACDAANCIADGAEGKTAPLTTKALDRIKEASKESDT